MEIHMSNALYVHGKVSSVFGASLDPTTALALVSMVMGVELSEIPMERKVALMESGGVRIQKDGKVLPEVIAAKADAARIEKWRLENPALAKLADEKREANRAAARANGGFAKR